MTDKHEALIFADDRWTSSGDDLYEWAIDAEDWIRRLHAENETLRTGYSAARLEIESLKAQLHAGKQINAAQFNLLAASIPGSAMRPPHGQAPAQAAPAAVAYLDIGAGGYLDLGTDLTDEALSRLPKGRHALVIAGTYGIDGYIAAPTTQPAPKQEAQEPVAWRLVPADATDDMMAAFAKAAAADVDWHNATEADRQEVRDGFCPAYRAMLKAAPQPSPAARGDALDVVLDAFENKTRGIQQAHIAAALVAELRAAIEAASTTPTAQVDALSDAVRVPLDSLHADAAYLIGRLREGSMPYARVIEIIRERVDAAKAAIHARAAKGDIPDVVDVPDQCPYFGPSPHRDVWLAGWYAARAAQEGNSHDN